MVFRRSRIHGAHRGTHRYGRGDSTHRYADVFDRFAGAVRRGRGGRQRGDQHAMA